MQFAAECAQLCVAHHCRGLGTFATYVAAKAHAHEVDIHENAARRHGGQQRGTMHARVSGADRRVELAQTDTIAVNLAEPMKPAGRGPSGRANRPLCRASGRGPPIPALQVLGVGDGGDEQPGEDCPAVEGILGEETGKERPVERASRALAPAA